jgi:IMP dehydrogenase
MYHDFPLALSYDDVLISPQYSKIKSRSLVNLSTQITPRVKLGIPLISINMSDVTGIEMAIALGKAGGLSFLPRFCTPEKQADMVTQVKKAGVKVGAAIGCKEGYLIRAEVLVNAGVDILTLDVAHGHMQSALDATAQLKNKFGEKVDVISGVIATYEGACDLYKNGADCVRVGVGPGTICITRIKTGSGVPQITAILEASRAARKFGRTILCDGGTKNHGDIVKGLAAGASAVVIGSQFAGHDEAPGEIIIKDNQKYKTYNASTSYTEKKMQAKVLKDIDKNYVKHIEGIESLVKYKGPLNETLDVMLADIRSGFAYSGAKNIEEFWEKAHFIRVTSLGFRENGYHDVLIHQ